MKRRSWYKYVWREGIGLCVVDIPITTQRKRALPGHGYEPNKRRAAWMLADPCAYCGGPATEWDHITPRKRDGTHDADDNLVRCCHPCNHEKSSRPLLRFLAIRAQRKATGTYRRLPEMRLRATCRGIA